MLGCGRSLGHVVARVGIGRLRRRSVRVMGVALRRSGLGQGKQGDASACAGKGTDSQKGLLQKI